MVLLKSLFSHFHSYFVDNWFLYTDFILHNFDKIFSSFFGIYFWLFSTQAITLSANLFLSNLYVFCFFPCLIALVMTSAVKLKRKGESGNSYLIRDLSIKVLSLLFSSCDGNCNTFVDFHNRSSSLSFLSCWEFFVCLLNSFLNESFFFLDVEFLSITFFASLRWSYVFDFLMLHS